MSTTSGWGTYRGDGEARPGEPLPPSPPWRRFDGVVPRSPVGPASVDGPGNGAGRDAEQAIGELPGILLRARTYRPDAEVVNMVNAALCVRRPLLVTGKPGTGKSTLAYSVAHELGLGRVLYWPISSRTQLQDGLYRYDAIGRLQEANLRRGGAGDPELPSIGRYLRLGPLGTALLPAARPRVLLIDEFDKSDIDLPNDLLNVFEEGSFEIPELARLDDRDAVRVATADPAGHAEVHDGLVRSHEFPFVVITSNGERDFPAAFLRRCLRLYMQPPSPERIAGIVEAQLGPEALDASRHLIEAFLQRREWSDLATDQLLNAIHLSMIGVDVDPTAREQLINAILQPLEAPDPLL